MNLSHGTGCKSASGKSAATAVFILWLCVACIIGTTGSAGAQALRGGGVSSSATTAVSAYLEHTEISGRSGDPVIVRILSTPAKIPSGFFITSLVDARLVPPGEPPAVLPGFPEITIRCFTPGDYFFRVRVNLVGRSSCGGVEASTLSDQELKVTIVP